MNKFAVPVAILAIIVAAAVVAYTLGANQTRQSEQITPTPTTGLPSEPTKQENTPTTISQPTASKSQVTENIVASVQSKNTAALEGYMAENVSVILYATECCGILNSQKATEQMSYLNNGTPPWDFSSSSTIAQKLINADPANFAGRVIGVASNGMAVSFNLNAQNKIDKILITADYKLISP